MMMNRDRVEDSRYSSVSIDDYRETYEVGPVSYTHLSGPSVVSGSAQCPGPAVKFPLCVAIRGRLRYNNHIDSAL